MSDVKRWAHTVAWEGLQISAAYMAISQGGEYVMHDDYAALEAERDALAAELAAIKGQEPAGVVHFRKGGGISMLQVELNTTLHPGTKLYTLPTTPEEGENARLVERTGYLVEFVQQMARQQGEPYYQKLAKAALKKWSEL